MRFLGLGMLLGGLGRVGEGFWGRVMALGSLYEWSVLVCEGYRF